MALQEIIKKDLIEALKNRDSQKSSVLRMLQAAVKNKEIDLNRAEMTDEIILEVIAKEAKRRKEAIAEFERGGRPELAESEKRELEMLNLYLPEQASDEEIENVAEKIIGDVGASGKDDFGKVMGAAAKELKGKADGNRIKAIVEKLLHC